MNVLEVIRIMTNATTCCFCGQCWRAIPPNVIVDHCGTRALRRYSYEHICTHDLDIRDWRYLDDPPVFLVSKNVRLN